jgi:hypothetical protein
MHSLAMKRMSTLGMPTSIDSIGQVVVGEVVRKGEQDEFTPHTNVIEYNNSRTHSLKFIC